jgi:ferredoxin-NADP reductase
MYEIAVLHEQVGRGGSAAIHSSWQVGTRLALDHPTNQFPLQDDDRPAMLIAGGIGITPIKAITQVLKARGNTFELHYSGRSVADMAYRDRLALEFTGQLHLYFTRVPGGARIDLHAVMGAATADTLFYVCGPRRLIEAAESAARELAISAGRVQYESFEPKFLC